jgi:hypothetical protein
MSETERMIVPVGLGTNMILCGWLRKNSSSSLLFPAKVFLEDFVELGIYG